MREGESEINHELLRRAQRVCAGEDVATEHLHLKSHTLRAALADQIAPAV